MTLEISADSPVFHHSLHCSAPVISDVSRVNYFKMLRAGIDRTHLGTVCWCLTSEPHLLLIK
jgi:hypothetical protein